MRTVHLILIAAVLLGIAFAGCAGSSNTASNAAASSSVFEAAAPAAPLVCGKNERICYSCDGRFQFCAQFCPDCIPPLHDRDSTTPPEVASVTEVRGEACADPI
jgi:hypothetical protein